MLKFNVLFRCWAFIRFYFQAATKYRLHSPFVFELAMSVLEDKRWYYAFEAVEQLRAQMIHSDLSVWVEDFGTGASGRRTLAALASRTASNPAQGRMLFRLADWAKPATMLELGTALGIGAMYLQSGARNARLLSLEGSAEMAHVARVNLEALGLHRQARIMEGPIEKNLRPALEDLKQLDLVFFDGNHRRLPTLAYFETCLAHAQAHTVFIFDDMHHSPEMAQTWKEICAHPCVRLTVDFFELSLAFINPDFVEKQHFKVISSRWKCWQIW